jgi:hypothetical protein
VNSSVPLLSAVPIAANAAAPCRAIQATCASVSVLLTVVGLPNRPASPGNGGFLRGLAGRPSIAFSAAVSSPAT